MLIVSACSTAVKEPKVIEGKAQGTTFRIVYFPASDDVSDASIDSIFKVIDRSMSLWDSTSVISKWNKGDKEITPDAHFINVLQKSLEIAEITNGAFDPTVGPLVNAWGFGAKRAAELPEQLIDSLLKICGYKHVEILSGQVKAGLQNMQLDFNAIAQGYTVDVIYDYLVSQGINDFLVEVGGEMRAKGQKPGKNKWKAGIDKPNEDQSGERELEAAVILADKALATSGNYRAFYVKDGKKYAHTIDPKTGYPVDHNLLSASVIASDCMTADAYATVFMVMGTEKSMEFAGKHPELDVFLIFSENDSWKTWISPGMQNKIEEFKEKN